MHRNTKRPLADKKKGSDGTKGRQGGSTDKTAKPPNYNYTFFVPVKSFLPFSGKRNENKRIKTRKRVKPLTGWRGYPRKLCGIYAISPYVWTDKIEMVVSN